MNRPLYLRGTMVEAGQARELVIVDGVVADATPLPARDPDAAGAFAEITGCAQRLRALTGSAGRWFRPSQTRYSTPLIEREARKVGYQTCVSYDVDSLDYTDPGPDAIVSTVLGSTRPGSIVSLHLGHSGTVTALPAILRGLASRGLRPVTLTDLLSPQLGRSS